MSTIPFDLKIFNLLYEAAFFLLAGLMICWILVQFFLRKKAKCFFISAFILPVFVFGGYLFCVWSGWHYRMELRERYGRDSFGININRMPLEIAQEYAKHDYHPRARDVKGAAIQMTVLYVLAILIQTGGWIILRRRKTLHDSHGPGHNIK